MRPIILILLLAFTHFSTYAQTSNNFNPTTIDLNGSWEYLGFGKALMIKDSTIQRFHISSAGNTALSDSNLENFFSYYTLMVDSRDTIRLKDGVKTFILIRNNIDYNKGINENLANDPVYNFEILWNTFNEQYCYFKERKINWANYYKKYKPQVTEETTELELYLLFEKMLGEIKDGHISIDVPDNLEEAYDALQVNIEAEQDDEATNELGKQVQNLIVEKYLAQPKIFNKGEWTWGMAHPNVAYLKLKNMVSGAYYDIPESLPREEFWEQWWEKLNQAKNYHDEVAAGTRIMMDSMVTALGEAKAFIIDLRFNGGGFDDVSVEVLNHFVNESTEFCTKRVRVKGENIEIERMKLSPALKNFKGKLYILTSHLTASAAELLVLGSKEIPNSKTIGSTTEGIFSDILSKKLPNGWTFGLSNLINESLESISYENLGIPADHVLNYPKNTKDFYQYLLKNLEDGDDAIEKIIEENR